MGKLQKDSQGRFQNVSRVSTSVVKDTPTGRKSFSVAPAQVVELTQEEVEATNDRHRDAEESPLNNGMIEQIPEGESRHPDAPDLGRHPSGRLVADAVKKGDTERLDKLMSTIMDMGGIIRVRNVIQKHHSKNTPDEGVAVSVDSVVSRHEQRVSAIVESNRERSKKFIDQ